MDIISSVADLCKERDDLEDTVDRYEDWFSELIGKTIVVTRGSKRHRKFQELEITSFDHEGWTGEDDQGNEYLVSWSDIVSGRAVIQPAAQ
jgi:hypothetical protein